MVKMPFTSSININFTYLSLKAVYDMTILWRNHNIMKLSVISSWHFYFKHRPPVSEQNILSYMSECELNYTCCTVPFSSKLYTFCHVSKKESTLCRIQSQNVQPKIFSTTNLVQTSQKTHTNDYH